MTLKRILIGLAVSLAFGCVGAQSNPAAARNPILLLVEELATSSEAISLSGVFSPPVLTLEDPKRPYYLLDWKTSQQQDIKAVCEFLRKLDLVPVGKKSNALRGGLSSCTITFLRRDGSEVAIYMKGEGFLFNEMPFAPADENTGVSIELFELLKALHAPFVMRASREF